MKTINFDNVTVFIDDSGTALFDLTEISMKLNFTKKNSAGIKVIDNNRVIEHLTTLKIDPVSFNELSLITEDEYHQLALKSRSTEGQDFQLYMNQKVIPQIHKQIYESTQDEHNNDITNKYNELSATVAKYESTITDQSKLINELKDLVDTNQSVVEKLMSDLSDVRLTLVRNRGAFDELKDRVDSVQSILRGTEKANDKSIVNKLRNMF